MVHGKAKLIQFSEPDGHMCNTSANSLVQEYFAGIFNKQASNISKFTYVDDKDGPTAVRDDKSEIQLKG